MSTHKKNLNKEIIALFSGQSRNYTVPKLYVQLTGTHSLAIVLNQCVFWSDKSTNCKDGWFHKTYEEWFEEIGIPERTLRRRFVKLEGKGVIQTKIKKINGLNTLHVRPDMDKIIDLISIMLDSECPNRPQLPNGAEKVQKTCTKSAPTGHFGRSEPATLSDSTIYTDDYLQITTTVKPSVPTDENPSSSSFFTSKQKTELFQFKLPTDNRTDEQFLDHCQWHIEKQEVKLTKFQHLSGLKKILKGLFETKEFFKAKGFIDPEFEKQKAIKAAEQERLRYEAQEAMHQAKLQGEATTKAPQPERRGTRVSLAEMLKGFNHANSGGMQTQAL